MTETENLKSDNAILIKLSYYENLYPDEGDFTLVYNLNEAKQKYRDRLSADFWHRFRDILDDVIYNPSIKKEWKQLQINGYCVSDRCCCGECCRNNCNCCESCCTDCFTFNCCRFCCCRDQCHCCYGNCKSCASFRDYFIGAIHLIVWGMLTPLGLCMVIFGAIMMENWRYSLVFILIF